MNFALGDGGLLGQAEDIQDMAENSTQTEEEKRNNLAGELADLLPFQPHDTPEPESGGERFEMKYGVIEVKWLQGTTNNVSTVPNDPKIRNISNGIMELVKFDEESQEWVSGKEYSYVAGTETEDNTQSKWANARVTINGVNSYFVWIPRYAYRIVYFKDETSKNEYKNGTITEEQAIEEGKLVGYSDSRGIVTAEGKRVDSIISSSNTTHTMVSKDYFMPHPAFLDGSESGLNNGFENGEWDEDLEGLWIGKYKAARSNATDTGMGSATSIKVQPGVQSWRAIKIGDMYTYGQNYSNELQSHMLKNSEWGVVTYLTESAYGRNGTEINQNTSYITGYAQESDENEDYTSSDGQKASSTGNVYGVFDLYCRRHTEYVAAYYNGEDANQTYMANGESFAKINGKSTKYATVYGIGNDVVMKENYKYGDATYETLNWHLDSGSNLSQNAIFLNRIGVTVSDRDRYI